MSEKKTIQVNPNFLLGKKSNKTEKRKRKKKDLTSLIKPNNVKSSLINKIKNYQNQSKKTLNKNKGANKENEKFTNDFNDNLKYLENIIKKKKEKKRLKKERKKQRSLRNQQINTVNTSTVTPQAINSSKITTPQLGGNIQVNIPTVSLKPPEQNTNLNQSIQQLKQPITQTLKPPNSDIMDKSNDKKVGGVKIQNEPIEIKQNQLHNFTQKEPPYGCLKGGTKPTFSQYRKTIKQNQSTPINPPKLNFIDTQDKPNYFDRQYKLSNLRNALSTPNNTNINLSMGGSEQFGGFGGGYKKEKKYINQKIRKTIKKYKLGKIKNKVGVLVKSGLTRKKVKDEQKILKDTCLSDVKKYLRKHNFIKAGTAAPEDILRQMYEESFLSGDIFNKNPDNLLHNYLNDEENFL